MSKLGDLLRSRNTTPPAAPEPVSIVEVDAGPEQSSNPFSWGAREPVEYSKDLDRILKLPRRDSNYDSIAPQDYIDSLTESLRRPGGTRSLRPIQAAALREASEVRGFLGPIGVGAGKTDISVLLPAVLGSRVAVLLVPPALKKKLVEVEYPYLQTQWKLPQLFGSKTYYPGTTGLLYVVSYSQLSTAKGTDVLDDIKPDLIVADEVHALAGNSARRKRFDRYMKANPSTLFCGMSGTVTSKSIKEYAHLAKYAFHQGSPLPLHYPTLDAWSAVIDPSKNENPPGALVRLCAPGEEVRAAFGRRLIETPGVVATKSNRIGSSLVINRREIKTPPAVNAALDVLRADWESPSGDILKDALSVARYGNQLSTGHYTRWVWPATVNKSLKAEWLECRRNWGLEVRDMLKGDAKKGMDSPLLLARAAIAGKWKSDAFEPWRDIARAYRTITGKRQPPTEAVWIDDFMVRDAVEWGKQNHGIIWYEHDALGKAIAAAGQFPRYGAATDCPTAVDPKTGQTVPGIVLEPGTRTVVASLDSFGTGWNLQQFTKTLYTTTPSSGKLMEQSLGRCHREGQTADEVNAYLYLHTPELKKSLTSARNSAIYIEGSLQNEQKLLYATYSFDPEKP